jgi:hypothetical protein
MCDKFVSAASVESPDSNYSVIFWPDLGSAEMQRARATAAIEASRQIALHRCGFQIEISPVLDEVSYRLTRGVIWRMERAINGDRTILERAIILLIDVQREVLLTLAAAFNKDGPLGGRQVWHR